MKRTISIILLTSLIAPYTTYGFDIWGQMKEEYWETTVESGQFFNQKKIGVYGDEEVSIETKAEEEKDFIWEIMITEFEEFSEIPTKQPQDQDELDWEWWWINIPITDFEWLKLAIEWVAQYQPEWYDKVINLWAQSEIQEYLLSLSSVQDTIEQRNRVSELIFAIWKSLSDIAFIENSWEFNLNESEYELLESMYLMIENNANFLQDRMIGFTDFMNYIKSVIWGYWVVNWPGKIIPNINNSFSYWILSTKWIWNYLNNKGWDVQYQRRQSKTTWTSWTTIYTNTSKTRQYVQWASSQQTQPANNIWIIKQTCANASQTPVIWLPASWSWIAWWNPSTFYNWWVRYNSSWLPVANSDPYSLVNCKRIPNPCWYVPEWAGQIYYSWWSVCCKDSSWASQCF